MPDQDLSMEEIMNLQASEDLATAANETPPTGEYLAACFSVKARRIDSANQYNPNRVYYSVGCTLHEVDELGTPGPSVGRTWFRCSPEARRKENGDLDTQTSLYLELCRELGVDFLAPRELYANLANGDAVFKVWGKDSWRPENTWDRVYMETEDYEKRAQCQRQGYKGEFNVFRVLKTPGSAATPAVMDDDDLPF